MNNEQAYEHEQQATDHEQRVYQHALPRHMSSKQKKEIGGASVAAYVPGSFACKYDRYQVPVGNNNICEKYCYHK